MVKHWRKARDISSNLIEVYTKYIILMWVKRFGNYTNIKIIIFKYSKIKYLPLIIMRTYFSW